MIGQENYHNPLNQSDAELKPTASRSVFPPFGQFACFHFELSLAPCNIFLRSDWRSDNYGCGFMALNRKAFRVAQK